MASLSSSADASAAEPEPPAADYSAQEALFAKIKLKMESLKPLISDITLKNPEESYDGKWKITAKYQTETRRRRTPVPDPIMVSFSRGANEDRLAIGTSERIRVGDKAALLNDLEEIGVTEDMKELLNEPTDASQEGGGRRKALNKRRKSRGGKSRRRKSRRRRTRTRRRKRKTQGRRR